MLQETRTTVNSWMNLKFDQIQSGTAEFAALEEKSL